MTVPETLRTGQGSGDNTDVMRVQSKLMALVFLLVKKAATSAAIYCKHQGISTVDIPHIRLALKHESMYFFDCDNLEAETDTLIDQIQSWDETLSADSDDISSVLDKMVDQIERDTEGERTTLMCTCDICHGIATVSEKWDAYEPDDAAKVFLKQQMEYIDTLYEQDQDDEI
jgi:hypothetical protein